MTKNNKHIDIAFSSCPNDTFVFHALLNNLVDTKGLTFSPFIDDVESLNQQAKKGMHQVSKLSFAAWLNLRDKYELLDSGAALGFGCGPLLVAHSKKTLGFSDVDAHFALHNATLMMPHTGRKTSTFLASKMAWFE